jgi:hypothetical protein
MPSYKKEVKIPGKGSQEIFDIVSTTLDKFLEKASVGKFDVQRDTAKKTIDIKSAVFSGQLSCHEGGIKLDASLSLMATPFKSKIDEGIDKWISKVFG